MSLLGFAELGKFALGQGRNNVISFVALDSMGSFTIAATALDLDAAVVNQTVPNFTSAATATGLQRLVLAQTLSNFTLAANVFGGNSVRLNLTMAAITSLGTIVTPDGAVLSQMLANFTLAGTVFDPAAITLNYTIPPFTMTSRSRQYDNFPGSPPPDYPVIKTHRPAQIQTIYGGSYAERAPDGINAALPATFDLTWSYLTLAQKNVFQNFLESRFGASRFVYTVPGFNDSFFFSCSVWKFDLIAPGFWNLSATFERKFDLA